MTSLPEPPSTKTRGTGKTLGATANVSVPGPRLATAPTKSTHQHSASNEGVQGYLQIAALGARDWQSVPAVIAWPRTSVNRIPGGSTPVRLPTESTTIELLSADSVLEYVA